MTQYTVYDKTNDRDIDVDSRKEGQDKVEDFAGELELDLLKDGEVIESNYQEVENTVESDGGQPKTHMVEASDNYVDDKPKTVETEVVNSPEQLSQDPIGWLQSHNKDFVNTIKGTPAISKMGFRFIQAQFGITTESEVVETFDDPTGVVVWAKAELPDGQAAEAHGEGYLTESKVDDNEFVRYADTRAKNRAISDLTSAGALAVSELSGE